MRPRQTPSSMPDLVAGKPISTSLGDYLKAIWNVARPSAYPRRWWGVCCREGKLGEGLF